MVCLAGGLPFLKGASMKVALAGSVRITRHLVHRSRAGISGRPSGAGTRRGILQVVPVRVSALT